MKRLWMIAVFILLMSSPAFGDIIGDNMNIEWWYPNAGTVITEWTGTVTDPGVEWYAGLGVGNVDVKDGLITIENLTMGWSGSSGFNGFVFTDLTVNHDLFTSFSLVSIGGYPPSIAPILSFTSDSLTVNFNASSASNLGAGSGQFYTFAYTTISNSVPEPTTMMLLGLGLIGLAGVRRKFKN